MIIEKIVHIVLTVVDILTIVRIYEKVIGFSVIKFKQDRKVLLFGTQKINIH